MEDIFFIIDYYYDSLHFYALIQFEILTMQKCIKVTDVFRNI